MNEQPYSKAYESAALALLLQYPDTSGAVIRSSLTPDHFYLAHNRQLFEAIQKHHHDGEVAILDAAMKGRAFSVNAGTEYFEKLRNTKISEKRREESISKLSELLCCRKLMDFGPELVSAAETGEYSVAQAKVSEMLESVTKSARSDDGKSTIKECLVEMIGEVEEMLSTGKTICKPMGLRQLDMTTGGLISEMIMIAGPTSSGKSALALEYVIANCLEHKRPGVVFSYEMNRSAVTKRLVARIAGVSLSKLMGISPDGGSVKFRKDELIAIKRAAEKLNECKLFIEDDPLRTIEGVWDRAVEIKAMEGDLGVVMIDYCQIVPSSPHTLKDTRERQVSHQGTKAKQLQMHLNAPVILLSQLAQDFTLRESKALEQHAGTLLKVERGEDPRTGQVISDESIYVWKNRVGQRFVRIPIVFDGERQKFTER